MTILSRTASSVLLLMLLFGCARTLPSQSPVAVNPIQLESGEWRIADQVFVVTDASGTMYMEKTFPEAKALTQSFVAAMPAADVRSERPGPYRAALIGFGGDEREGASISSFDRGRLASAASALEIMGDASGTGGTTPLDEVLGEIDGAIDPNGGKVAVVVFSDGLPDEPDAALYNAYSMIASHGAPVCIHTVHTGDAPEGADFLKRLGTMTPCSSARGARSLDNPTAIQNFSRKVFAGLAPKLPAVAASRGDPCQGIVRLRGIEFAFDEAEVTGESSAVLDEAAVRLNECPNVSISVEGHTDAIGPETYNQGLSERRADATRRYFIQKGIDPGRISIHGFGESQPVASNDSDEGRAENRRVVLKPLR